MAGADDAEILANPGEYTVEEVKRALDDATPEQAAQTQLVEATGKARKAVADYVHPSERSSGEEDDGDSDDEPRYTALEWKDYARSVLGCSPHAVAGALFDASPDRRFTAQQVKARLVKFQAREIDPPSGSQGGG